MTRMIRTAVIAVLLACLAVPVYAQQTESLTQMTLATSATFLVRLQYIMTQQARVVLEETGVGSTHACRAGYAQGIVSNVQAAAARGSVMVVGGVNLIGTVVPNANANLIDSSASDAAILSQVATFWNQLAGCDTGS
jgi:hypothetical protein